MVFKAVQLIVNFLIIWRKKMKIKHSLALMSTLIIALFAASVVSAHGKTTVGNFDLEIGFHNEPVIVGMPNSLDLFVTDSTTGKMVNGLETTLSAEIVFGASRKSLTISPQDGVDGGYTAYVIPTATGDYTWHIFGKINDTPVDVSMTSSPDTFNSAETSSTYLFPPPAAGAPDPAAQAASSASTALLVGAGGLVVGLIALVVGLVAMQSAHRQNS
jgi:hypothetical protein